MEHWIGRLSPQQICRLLEFKNSAGELYDATNLDQCQCVHRTVAVLGSLVIDNGSNLLFSADEGLLTPQDMTD